MSTFNRIVSSPAVILIIQTALRRKDLGVAGGVSVIDSGSLSKGLVLKKSQKTVIDGSREIALKLVGNVRRTALFNNGIGPCRGRCDGKVVTRECEGLVSGLIVD